MCSYRSITSPGLFEHAHAKRVLFDLERAACDLSLIHISVVAGLDDASRLPLAWHPEETEAHNRAKSIAPKRLFRGPFSNMGKETSADYEKKSKALREKHGKTPAPLHYLEYWADGKRTLADIAHLIESETGFYNMDALVDY